jgi:membrane fusion protein, multidrug efflux system
MRIVVAILGLLLLVGALAGVKGAQIASLMAFGKQYEKSGPPPESVSTAVAREQSWEGTLSAVGSIAAVKGVSVSNEASGTVSRIAFESGSVVHQGDVLVELETSVERAQLASARARRALADVSLRRAIALFESNSIARADLDNAQSALDSATADANAVEAQIGRKVVRAPFTGRLGIRAVNLGQYLGPGAPVATLEATDSVYVDFTLPQQRLAALSVGMPVRAEIAGASGAPIEGTVSAIDPAIDPVTRTIKVRATVPNAEERLRPGMFVNVTVVLPTQAPIVTVPSTAVLHAPYGDSVFVVEDKSGANAKVRQQFVRLGESRGDFVAVVDGVKPDQEVVTAGAFKLRNGMKIAIKPDVRPPPELTPHPDNR